MVHGSTFSAEPVPQGPSLPHAHCATSPLVDDELNALLEYSVSTLPFAAASTLDKTPFETGFSSVRRGGQFTSAPASRLETPASQAWLSATLPLMGTMLLGRLIWIAVFFVALLGVIVLTGGER